MTMRGNFAIFASVLALALTAVLSAEAQTGGSRFRNRLGQRARPAPGAARQSAAQGGEAANAGPAGDPLKDVPRGTNGVPVRLAFENASLDVLLYAYADVADRILIQAPALPKAQVTLKSFKDRDLTKEQYLNALERELTMNGVVLQEVGDLYLYALDRKTVRTKGIRTSMETPPSGALEETGKVVSQLIRLHNIAADEAQKALEGFKDQNGLFQVFERNNSILVTDTQENVNRMLELVKAIDVANPVNEEVFERPIRFASATEIKTSLELIVTESQKDEQQPAKSGVKTSGAPGFQRQMQPPPGSRLLNVPRPGMRQPPEPQQTPNATMTAGISEADRGMIRGKVLIVADERSNKLIIITSKANMNFFDKVITALDVPTTPEVRVEVVRLKYADAEEVSSMLNDLIGASSSGSPQQKGNQNQATQRGGGAATRNLSQGGRPGAQTSRRLPQAAQRSAAAALGELNKDNIKILADKRINGIVIMARKDDMRAVKDVVEEMDVRLSQVLIETVIVQVELGDDLQTGIDWVQRGRARGTAARTDSYGRALYEYTNASGEKFIGARGTSVRNDSGVVDFIPKDDASMPEGASIVGLMKNVVVRDGLYNNGNYMLGGGGGSGTSSLLGLQGLGESMSDKLNKLKSSGIDTSEMNDAQIINLANQFASAEVNPVGSGLNYLLKSDKLNISAVIKASKSDSRTKVLASPILMTVDNQEATIEATDMIYLFSGYQYSGSANYGSQVRNYEKRDIGLTVKVTPKINPNGTVMLEVEQKFETEGPLQNVPNESGGTDPYATVTTRKIQSDVSVENGQTIVMGGLTKKTNVDTENGIPILKDIPLIGKWLFGSVVQKENRSELLVFMTPYVMDEAAQAQAEAMRRKKALSDPRPWEDNGWSLSPVADPVSRKEQLRRLRDEWARQDDERRAKRETEEAKRKRALELKKMDAEDRKAWLERNAEAVREELEQFNDEQKDLRELVDEIRRRSDEKDLVEEEKRELAPVLEEIRAREAAEAANAKPATPAPVAAPAEPLAQPPDGKDR